MKKIGLILFGFLIFIAWTNSGSNFSQVINRFPFYTYPDTTSGGSGEPAGNIMPNWGFDTDISDWTGFGNWSWENYGGNGVGRHTTENTSSFGHDETDFVIAGATYTVIFTIIDMTVGQVRFRVGTLGYGSYRSTNGTYEEDIVQSGGTGTCNFVPSLDFDGAVDEVSVVYKSGP